MHNLKSIYELIDYEQFRKRPQLFLGKKSISELKLFMSGYHTCEFFNNIKSETQPPFWLFFHWICNYYNHNGSFYNWDGIILQNSNNNENKAFDIFLEKFDEFRKYEPINIISTKLSQKSIDFYNSNEFGGYNVINGNSTKIEPSEELFIVEYNLEFGNTIHYRKNSQNTQSPDYCKTQNDAIQILEKCYGNDLVWEQVEKDKLKSVYELIN